MDHSLSNLQIEIKTDVMDNGMIKVIVINIYFYLFKFIQKYLSKYTFW